MPSTISREYGERQHHVSYDYYANGWLKDVMSGSQSIAGYSYDAAGNSNTVSYGNGTSTVYAYKSGDPRYLIDSITHKRGATVLATIGYPTRDAMGDPESMTDWTGTWTYDYDKNNRLSLATPPVPVPDQPAGATYLYDWVGNRVRPPADPGPNPPTETNKMAYNNVDQLVTWPGMHGKVVSGVVTPGYTYYPDGSLYQVLDANAAVTQTTYTYTDDGLLSKSYAGGIDPANLKSIHIWDADKNRVQVVMGGGTYSFVYDRTAGIPAVIEESDGANSVHYFREPGGELIARLKGSDWRWYCFDELGSTRLLTDSAGDATDAYAYDAYGHLLSHTDPDPTDGVDMTDDNPYQYVGRLGYYTHWQDAEFGLLQLGVRFYDGEARSFTQRDSVGGKSSPYMYVEGRLLSAVDPSGATSLEVWLTMEGVVPHTFVCIGSLCLGFYPQSAKRALANCCLPSRYGKCCDDGEVRNDADRREGGKLLMKRELSADEEKRIREGLDKWRRGTHKWCLVPNFPLADNCWTFAGRVWEGWLGSWFGI